MDNTITMPSGQHIARTTGLGLDHATSAPNQPEPQQMAWVHSFQFQRLIAQHPAEFRLGYVEGDRAAGVTFDNDTEGERSQAYDLGRSLRRGIWS